MGMGWGWIIKFPINLVTKEVTPLLLGCLIEDLDIRGDGNLDKSSMVSLLEDENLIHV